MVTLGVGTPEGELIPIEEQGVVTYLKDSTGRIVRTRLDEETLQAVATAGGGQYYHALRGDFGLMRFYEEQVEAQREQGGRETMEPINRYQIPLLVAVLLLGLEVMVAKGRR